MREAFEGLTVVLGMIAVGAACAFLTRLAVEFGWTEGRILAAPSWHYLALCTAATAGAGLSLVASLKIGARGRW